MDSTAPSFVGALGFFIAVSLELVQFLVPVFLLVRHQPRRDGFTMRAVLSLVALVFVDIVIQAAVYFGTAFVQDTALRYLINFTCYSLLIIAFVPAVLVCYETSVYNAFFVASAGYTMQNLGTGLGELVRILWEGCTGEAMGVVPTFIVSLLGVSLVLAVAYRVFICRVDHMGRLDEEARDMLGMVGLVILVVIAYDVVIRGLGNHEVSTDFLVTLRVVHAAVCVFILYAEYEMLFNARLRTEVAMERRLSAERARQYELSRETIAAVNRRVHDIRHQVLRELDGAKVDRQTLAEVAREIDVYGAMVNTGNDALDTILTEKSLLCQREGIRLSCIADGSVLAWMDAADLYSLFGDVIDATLDEVRSLDDPDKKTVSLVLRRAAGLAVLHVEHFASGASKGEGRLAEASQLSERLGGSLVTASRGGTRSIDVLLPSSQ